MILSAFTHMPNDWHRETHAIELGALLRLADSHRAASVSRTALTDSRVRRWSMHDLVPVHVELKSVMKFKLASGT